MWIQSWQNCIQGKERNRSVCAELEPGECMTGRRGLNVAVTEEREHKLEICCYTAEY